MKFPILSVGKCGGIHSQSGGFPFSLGYTCLRNLSCGKECSMAKKALIAVSGGIAVYKVCQVVSDLGKRGVDVQVIMTENATKFVTPLTFEALSKNMVFTDTFDYSYDVMSPMDKYLSTDKDNMFVGWKWTKVDQMSYMRDATLTYELETNAGFSIKAMARHRNDEPAGGVLQYWKNDGNIAGSWDDTNTFVKDITTTELGVTLRYAPGETFVNTKQRRVPVSLDAPIFSLSHTIGLKGVLGGEYNFNLTEASIRKRFWFGSWGKLDITARAGAQWNTVPFPLLNLPMANLSYITQHNESFSIINNMEFLNDRFASMSISYDMNGKLFNRIPLLKNLKWREMFRVRALWGTLTDKNNPFKSSNPDLFRFPTRDGKFTSFVMDPKVPYVEASVGIYNIFKLLHVEYVHRFTYRDNPGINKNGIRFMVLMVF